MARTFVTRRVVVDGHETRFLESRGGDGPPIVLVATTFLLARSYRGVAQELAARGRRKVFVVEPPGSGFSARLASPWTPTAYARWLLQFLEGSRTEREARVAGRIGFLGGSGDGRPGAGAFGALGALGALVATPVGTPAHAASQTAPQAAAAGYALLNVGTFHGDEVAAARVTQGWHALVRAKDGFRLVPVSIAVKTVRDEIVDAEGAPPTGKEITVTTPLPDTPVALLRAPAGKAWPKGAFAGNADGPSDVEPGRPPHVARVGAGAWTFAAKGTPRKEEGTDARVWTRYALSVSHGGVTQVLLRAGKDEVVGGDGTPGLVWTGDLDGDGKLDAILDLSTHDNVGKLTLFLSSAARPGELLREVARLETTGC